MNHAIHVVGVDQERRYRGEGGVGQHGFGDGLQDDPQRHLDAIGPVARVDGRRDRFGLQDTESLNVLTVKDEKIRCAAEAQLGIAQIFMGGFYLPVGSQFLDCFRDSRLHPAATA